MNLAIIIPFRGTMSDKSRLRKDLKEPVVKQLLYHMTQNLIHEIQKISNGITIYLLTRKKELNFIGTYTILEDEGNELNESISLAMNRIDEDIVVIIMADLPLITSENIKEVIKISSSENKVVLAPTKDFGTSILCFKKALKLPKVFGEKSALRFKKWFELNSIPHIILDYKEVYRDIDTFKDLIELKQSNFLPEWINKILKDCI